MVSVSNHDEAGVSLSGMATKERKHFQGCHSGENRNPVTLSGAQSGQATFYDSFFTQ